MKSQNQDNFSKIILAVDGSEHSLAATHYLNNLPLTECCNICVIAVLDTPHTPRRQLLLAALEQACGILKGNHPDVECGLLHGNPASSILDFADHFQPNLIILGAKGLRATLGILLGGVAQQVVEYSKWPILVIRPLHPPPHRIVIGVDGSENNRAVITYLRLFPSSLKDELHLLHVIPPSLPYEPGAITRTWQIGTDGFLIPPVEYLAEKDDIQKKYDDKGREILKLAAHALENSNFTMKSALLRGDAATEILTYSKDHSIDIIAVGSRGLSEIKAWLLGSVSRKLVHYASCSVLIVKG
jgi:nucleotide-binding universal stress UspA family protein